MCVAKEQPFEAWQDYDALIPALILCEADESKAKSCSSFVVWTKSVHLSLLTRMPPIHPPSIQVSPQKLKAPSISLAAGGFLLADNLQSSRQTLNHQKIIITGAVLCGSSTLFIFSITGRWFLKWLTCFQFGTGCAREQNQYQHKSKDKGEQGKKTCVLRSQLLDRTILVTQRWLSYAQGQTLVYDCDTHW